MKIKIWQLLAFLTLICLILATYTSYTRTTFIHEGVCSVVSGGHYSVGCDVLHEELLDLLNRKGFSQVERPKWTDSEKIDEYRHDAFDPPDWVPAKESWVLCHKRDARCYVRIKSDSMFLNATVVNSRKLYLHQAAETDERFADDVGMALKNGMEQLDRKYTMP